MLKKLIIFLLVLVPLVALGAKPLDTLEIKITDLSYQAQIDYFSDLFGVDNSLVKGMVQCESINWNPQAKGDYKNGKPLAFGLFQYHKETFERHSKKFGEELDYYSSYDQIKLGTWAIANGYGREWTSYRAIENGGTYSFYSNLLEKHFTAKCDRIK